jgi:hypothetical protein
MSSWEGKPRKFSTLAALPGARLSPQRDSSAMPRHLVGLSRMSSLLASEQPLIAFSSICDVALVARDGAGSRANRPVTVPFTGAEHDWSAIEIATWTSRSLGASLRLIGTAADPASGRRDASRAAGAPTSWCNRSSASPRSPCSSRLATTADRGDGGCRPARPRTHTAMASGGTRRRPPGRRERPPGRPPPRAP